MSPSGEFTLFVFSFYISSLYSQHSNGVAEGFKHWSMSLANLNYSSWLLLQVHPTILNARSPFKNIAFLRRANGTFQSRRVWMQTSQTTPCGCQLRQAYEHEPLGTAPELDRTLNDCYISLYGPFDSFRDVIRDTNTPPFRDNAWSTRDLAQNSRWASFIL